MTPTAEDMLSSPAVDVIVDAPQWQEHTAADETVRRAVAAAAPPSAHGAEVAVLLTSDEAVRAMNLRWRHKDAATNVLSFPGPATGPGMPRMLGDIVVAYETTAQEARAQGIPFDHHLGHLVVHGFLHLLGYDHQSDAEADKMEGLEREILKRLAIPDPYAAPDADV